MSLGNLVPFGYVRDGAAEIDSSIRLTIPVTRVSNLQVLEEAELIHPPLPRRFLLFVTVATAIRLTSSPNRRYGKSTVTNAATSMITSMSILLWALVMR